MVALTFEIGSQTIRASLPERSVQRWRVMSEGTHWEWRGFGTLTQHSREAFERRPLKFAKGPAWDETKDEYIWIPGSEINVKLRTGGVEQGLKLKRFVRRENDLELWFENPAELFLFNHLDAATLTKLANILDLKFGKIPNPPLTAAQVLEIFRQGSPKPLVVTVHKRRQTRLHSHTVQIEQAFIKAVTIDDASVALGRALSSVAVENVEDLTPSSPDQVNGARDEIDAAVTSLELRGAGFEEKNYLRAIAQWAAAARK